MKRELEMLCELEMVKAEPGDGRRKYYVADLDHGGWRILDEILRQYSDGKETPTQALRSV